MEDQVKGDQEGEEQSTKSMISAAESSNIPDGIQEKESKQDQDVQKIGEDKNEEVVDDVGAGDVDDDGEVSSTTGSKRRRPLGQLEAGGEEDVGGDDDDGFKTPTGPEHRIPVITECPPAPKKTRRDDSPAKRPQLQSFFYPPVAEI
ncbi:OLC1v1034831C1 [Oldenlandia corymbosa var. corymbosa]|uniref:OLC1v1034831C1 n=1 Tax=Oldenlandia corymbosa var. corymbosa TaxID=529605 RepID=A0AAV1CS86_OLDCO|nr:OLC1v1034831C1 [Oldenlandia corymbosa var. corymbosa]